MNTGFTRPEHGSRPTNLPRASKANGEEARERGEAPATTILLVSHLVEDHVYLRHLCDPARWGTREVNGYREAIAVIAEQHPDVVLCEASLPDGSWKDLLEALSRRVNPPYLIVTSRLADEYLWAEVLNLGGYDVLAKPFDPEEVCRVVGLACEHHQERQLRRAAGRSATTVRRSSSEHGVDHSAESKTVTAAMH
jgi:DNA-binding response OmpR family regulator